MSPQIQQILLSITILGLTVLLPVVPTFVIYKVFPGQQVSLSGPLQGFTVKAVGAFAGYVVVFLLAIPFVWRVFDQSSKAVVPTWTVRANLVALDRSGRSISADDALKGLQVRLDPRASWQAAPSRRPSFADEWTPGTTRRVTSSLGEGLP